PHFQHRPWVVVYSGMAGGDNDFRIDAVQMSAGDRNDFIRPFRTGAADVADDRKKPGQRELSQDGPRCPPSPPGFSAWGTGRLRPPGREAKPRPVCRAWCGIYCGPLWMLVPARD